jgi:hypothetical protein
VTFILPIRDIAESIDDVVTILNTISWVANDTAGHIESLKGDANVRSHGRTDAVRRTSVRTDSKPSKPTLRLRGISIKSNMRFGLNIDPEFD